MFSRGDFDINLVLRYDKLPKEVLRQAMLMQEHTFRKQVFELHRLYRVQQILMKDLYGKEVDVMGTVIQTHLGPSSNGAQPELLPAEKSLCTCPVVSTRLSMNSLQEHGVVFEQRLSVPQLCSSQNINHIFKDNFIKGNNFLCTQKPKEIKLGFQGQVKPSPEEVDLSFSIGWNKQRKVACKKTWDHIINLEDSNETTKVASKKTWDHIISLEDSNETLSSAEVFTPSVVEYGADVMYFGSNQDLSSTRSITRSPNKNQSEGTERSHSTVDSCFSKGVTQYCNVLVSEDMKTNRELFSSDERALLDLNRHPDELSFHPTDLDSAGSSTRTFLRDSNEIVGESHHKDTSHTAPNRIDQADDGCSNETSDLPKYTAPNGSDLSNLDSSSVAVLDNSVSHDGHTSKVELEGVNVTLGFQNGRHADLHKQAASGSRPGSKQTEDTRSSDKSMTRDKLDDMEVDGSPILCKSNSVANDLLCGKVTSESGIQLDNAGSSQVAKSPCQEDAESSGNNDSNFQIGDDQKGKAAEVDNEVKKGAVSLLFFMSECTRDQSKIGQKENDSNEQPQYSSDTFESMVLKLPECNADDDSCVSSKPFEVNNTDSTDCGITLRRGRRMKDFRRDILPNLASLSRHEISEDIKIMEAVLKSREYKKIMSKMKGGQKCVKPVRNRRSRLNYVGQKHHS